jgi:hypothetical protein
MVRILARYEASYLLAENVLLKRFPAGRLTDIEKYSLICGFNHFIITDKGLGGKT